MHITKVRQETAFSEIQSGNEVKWLTVSSHSGKSSIFPDQFHRLTSNGITFIQHIHKSYEQTPIYFLVAQPGSGCDCLNYAPPLVSI